MIGYEYGNTRLRARHARRLDEGDYTQLLTAADLDRMLGVLSATDYGEDVETAVARYSGLRRLDEAVRIHLADEARDLLSFYAGDVTERIGLALERWDIRNVTAILRAQSSPAGASSILPMLVPTERLDGAALAELAGQSGVRATIDLLLTWRLPDPATVRAIRRALPEFDATGDLLTVERAIHAAHAERVSAEDGDDPLSRVLAAETLARAVGIALRLREARMAGEPTGTVAAPPLRDRDVEDIVASDERDAVAEVVARRSHPPFVATAIAGWVEHGDTTRLRSELDAGVLEMATTAFRRDPLGIGVPTGYLWAQEQEARNLRLVARAHVHGLDRSDVERRLVVP